MYTYFLLQISTTFMAKQIQQDKSKRPRIGPKKVHVIFEERLAASGGIWNHEIPCSSYMDRLLNQLGY